MEVFKDAGSLVSGTSKTKEWTSGSGNAIFGDGTSNVSVSAYNGKVDHFKVWDTVLTDIGISQLYRQHNT